MMHNQRLQSQQIMCRSDNVLSNGLSIYCRALLPEGAEDSSLRINRCNSGAKQVRQASEEVDKFVHKGVQEG